MAETKDNPKVKMYSTKDVERLFGLSHESVMKYIQLGYLRAVKFGRVYKIREIDLEEFAKNGVPSISSKVRAKKPSETSPEDRQTPTQTDTDKYGGITAKKNS